MNFEAFTHLTRSQDEIFSASYTAAIYISKFLQLTEYIWSEHPDVRRNSHLRAYHGLAGHHQKNTAAPFNLLVLKLDSNVKAVLCAGDKAINYTELSKGFQYLQGNNNCEFLCTSLDVVVPAKGGVGLGAGVLVSPLTTTLGRGPLLISKTEQSMWDCIISKYVIRLLIHHNLTILKILDWSKQGTYHCTVWVKGLSDHTTWSGKFRHMSLSDSTEKGWWKASQSKPLFGDRMACISWSWNPTISLIRNGVENENNPKTFWCQETSNFPVNFLIINCRLFCVPKINLELLLFA
jgi:hypothetical protein